MSGENEVVVNGVMRCGGAIVATAKASEKSTPLCQDLNEKASTHTFWGE
jgi:hypothetical protein